MPDRLDYAINDHRKYNNKNLDVRFLGDGVSSDPRVRDNTGRMWVRKQLTDGFAQAVALPLDTNANIPIMTNIAVEVGYVGSDECILRAYRGGFLQNGISPGVTNPSDPQVNEDQPIPDIKQFLCKRSADSSKPWAVVVLDGYIEVDGVSHVFHQTEFDFNTAGLVPGAGNKVIGAVFVKSDMTLEGYACSVMLPADPPTETLINEIRQQAALNSMSVWGWVLEGDATGLNEDPSKNIDMRPKFTFPTSRSATLTTTDATQSTLASIPVAELQAVTIKAVVTGTKTDYSGSCGGELLAVVRRASGGNVTLVDSVTAEVHSSGAATFTLDVNTGTQSARVRVTGIAAQNWDWVVRYETLVS